MSYDIYCYRSKIGKPDLQEAEDAIEDEDETNLSSEDVHTIKEKLAEALINLNPKFERFAYDYEEIARSQNMSVDEAKQQFNQIELTPPETELATQIIISNNQVFITIPFWYSGEQAKKVFINLADYLKIIHQITGYFAYDPQTGDVFDPTNTVTSGLELYCKTTEQVVNIKDSNTTIEKPWWKFW